MSESTLKPCPFCGGEASIEKYCDMCSTEIDFKCARDKSPDAICAIGEEVFWVEHECKLLSNDEELYVGCFTSAREAIAAWNTRTSDALADYYRWKSAKGLTPEQHTQWNMELHRLLDGERHRIADLEQLVRDIYDVAARGEFDVGEEFKFSERMTKLGVVSE